MINDPAVNAFDGAVGCGEMLRQAREAAGLSLEQVSTQLRMPAQVVRSLEEEQWQRLGAPVFVKGQLRSYARLLGVDISGVLEQSPIARMETPALVSHMHTPRIRRVAENLGRRALYVVITAVLAVPVWYAAKGGFADRAPSTASLDIVPESGTVSAPATAQAPVDVAPARPQPAAPYIASMAPVRQAPVAAALTLDFTGDSWVDITAADGRTLEKALVRGGEKRSFQAGEVSRVVLGNASAVKVQQAGAAVDLAPYQRANVARFTVSSDGSVVPVSH